MTLPEKTSLKVGYRNGLAEATIARMLDKAVEREGKTGCTESAVLLRGLLMAFCACLLANKALRHVFSTLLIVLGN